MALNAIKMAVQSVMSYVDCRINNVWENVLKNRTHYAEFTSEISLVENHVITPKVVGVSGGVVTSISGVALEVGNTYVVTWEGVEYECVAQPIIDNLYKTNRVLLGNVDIHGLKTIYSFVDSSGKTYTPKSNGEPFCIVDLCIGGGFDIGTTSTDDFTFSIKQLVETVYQLDEKYLPKIQANWDQNDETARDYVKNRTHYAQEEEVLFEKEMVNSSTGDAFYFTSEIELVLGETIFVEIDDVTYKKDVTVYSENTSVNAICLTEEMGATFNIVPAGIYGNLVDASVKIYKKMIKQLDEKYIPDNYVKFNAEQSITSDEQLQARTNIGINDHEYPELVIVDKVSGYSYIISMIDGTLTSESLCTNEGITVVQTPTLTIYGANDTFDPTGMIITAVCEDGTTKEIIKYTCSDTGEDGVVTITYVERGITYTNTVTVTVIPGLEDFYYTDNGDETVTITGWKGTLNGVTSTEMVFPDDPRVIL